MGEQHLYRTTIPPVLEGTPRLLWSVIIPTYNCAKYLRETLKRILAQAPKPDVMQIVHLILSAEIRWIWQMVRTGLSLFHSEKAIRCQDAK